MQKTYDFFKKMGFPSRDAYDLPTSEKRFPDGAQYRIEIQAAEGPRCLEAIIEEADRFEIPIHRVSQGSGVMLQTDSETKEMLAMGKEKGIEVNMFVGPRGTWDISALSLSPLGAGIGLRTEGMDQMGYAIEDLKWGCKLGVRGFMIVDEGLLWMVNKMREHGEIPRDLVIKISAYMGSSNPVSVKMLQDLGADTYNATAALSLPRLASIRQAVDIPIDVYVETPDGFGGFIRHYEIPEMVRTLAPIYLKFGLKNAPDAYPAGKHNEALNIQMCRERVRRAKIGMDLLKRYYPEAKVSEPGAAGLGLPRV